MPARLTVTKKIVAAYLVLAFFGMVALTYALSSLRSQTRRAEQLVKEDIRALELARDLHGNLATQERLEKQFLLLKDADLLAILDQRHTEFSRDWEAIALVSAKAQESFEPAVSDYMESASQLLHLFTERQYAAAQTLAGHPLAMQRNELAGRLESYLIAQSAVIDATLLDLPQTNDRAYRIAFLLTFLGLACSLPVGLLVILGIYRSLGELSRATKQVAAGNFDFRISIDSQDEFGDLAREFSLMGRKLDELEKLHLDANPLTHLPGNLAIDRELEKRIRQGQPFAHMYIDLDHFKAYGDRYGYQAGSAVLAEVAGLIRTTVARQGDASDLVGHIGGDDYIVLTVPERVEAMARDLIAEFDRMIPKFYSKEDREAGQFVGRDRFGVERTFPLLSMSIAIILSQNLEFSSQQAFSWECAKMKDYLKTRPGSNYLINRRKKI